jgi:parallel beta-helix repeat protein
VFSDSSDCVIANNTLHKFTTPDGALILERCQGISINGLVLSDCGSGIVLRNTSDTTIANCRASRTAEGTADLSIDASNQNILLIGNSFSGKSEVAATAVKSR